MGVVITMITNGLVLKMAFLFASVTVEPSMRQMVGNSLKLVLQVIKNLIWYGLKKGGGLRKKVKLIEKLLIPDSKPLTKPVPVMTGKLKLNKLLRKRSERTSAWLSFYLIDAS